MLSPELEQSLSVIELQCQAVAAAVAGGEPQALEAASHALKQAAVQLAQLTEQLGGPQNAGPQLRARLKKVAAQLNIQRENLLRRTVVVERAVQTMMPAAVNQLTYGQHGRAGGYKAFAA